MAELNYDPRIPAVPTSWWWKTIRFVIIALWIVAALWVIRTVTADDDTEGLDQGQLVEELEQIGG